MLKIPVMVLKFLKILIDTMFADHRVYILLDYGEIQFSKSLSQRNLMKKS